MIRLVYAEQRKTHHTQDYFVRRWRMHAGFAIRMADFFSQVLLYMLNHRIVAPPALSTMDQTYAGVGELCFASFEEMDKSHAAPNMPAIFEDGDLVFARIDPIRVAGEFTTLIDRPHGQVRIFLFLKHQKEADAAAIELAARESMDTLLASDASFGNLVRRSAITNGSRTAIGYDAVIDLSFETEAAAATAWPIWKNAFDARTAEPQMFVRTMSILTKSAIIYDSAELSKVS